MHRFFVDQPIPAVGETVALSKEESQHAYRVLRLKPGETVCLLDGEGLFEGRIEAAEEGAVTVTVQAQLPSPECPVQITLLQGLPKGDKLDLIVQKATELGAYRVLTVEMERSVAKADKADKADKKTVRLQRVALEAAKQSGRAHVPEVLSTCTFTKALSFLDDEGFDAVFVAWEEEKTQGLFGAMQAAVEAQTHGGKPLKKIALIIGPEGGISGREYDLLKRHGAACCTLGKRILRTETAGLCALSVMMCALGEM